MLKTKEDAELEKDKRLQQWLDKIGHFHNKYYIENTKRYSNKYLDALWILYKSKYRLGSMFKRRHTLHEYMTCNDKENVIDVLIDFELIIQHPGSKKFIEFNDMCDTYKMLRTLERNSAL